MNISNIQHFSVGDGEGIRTTVFFKGCNLRCPWCHNPENLSGDPCVLYYENRQSEICGRQVSPEDILPELLEDQNFFSASGGGVTFSGGEVLLQANAAAALARKLQQEDISVWVDTAGCVHYSAFEMLNPFVDGYLFDFKTASAEKYKELGGNLQQVSDNIAHLLADKIPLRIRIPLIPGFNTDDQSVEQICTYLVNLNITAVDLLPFHRLGSAKYVAMGLVYAYKDIHPLSNEALENIRKHYAQHFNVTIER